jgi:hypothetical protein
MIAAAKSPEPRQPKIQSAAQAEYDRWRRWFSPPGVMQFPECPWRQGGTLTS